MAATAASRSARSIGPGAFEGDAGLATRPLARVMRCSIAASETRKARAICGTVRPETIRSASAICCVGGEIGMAADEEQAQDVVAVMRIVQPLGERRLGVAEIAEHVFVRQLGLAALAPHRVDGGVAADEDQPGVGSRGGPFCGHSVSAFRQAS